MEQKTNMISDEAVIKATGKSWHAWFNQIDLQDGMRKSHQEIVALLKEESEIDPWWQQMITVEYEKARGLRKQHEMPDGFQISKSKTIAAKPKALFIAWQDADLRKTWLEDPGFMIRKATKYKTLRITWIDGKSDVNVYFYPKKDKTQVSINHGKLPDEESALRMKGYWGEQLQKLAAIFK